MLVLDAGIGQNALHQLEGFDKRVNVSGLCLTKLDGTAKGGVILAIADRTGLPIRYIGIGEGIDDLRQFNARDFVKALFNQDNQDAD
jgi:fused signal recognition particle receptor